MYPCTDLPEDDDFIMPQPDCNMDMGEEYTAMRVIDSGEFGIVLELKDNTTENRIVCKIFPFHIEDGKYLEPSIISKSALQELNIACKLNQISEETPVFVKTFGWTVCDQIPRQWQRLPDFTFPQRHKEQKTVTYAFLFMSHGGTPLETLKKTMTINDKLVALFMVLHGLLIAYKRFGFVHNDLHDGNILFNNDPTTETSLRLEMNPHTSATVSNPNRLMPSIIDFGFGTLNKSHKRPTGDLVRLFRAFEIDYDYDENEYDIEYEERLQRILLNFPQFDAIRKIVQSKRAKFQSRVCDVCSTNIATVQWKSLPWLAFCNKKCAHQVYGLAALNKKI